MIPSATKPPALGLIRNRELLLLVTLLLYIGLTPFLKNFVGLQLINNVAFMAILLTAILAVSQTRRQTVAAILLALPMAILIWLAHWMAHPLVGVLSLLCSLLFLGFTLVVIFRFIFRQNRVGQEVICAAVSVYLLMGLFWAIIYALSEIIHPGSFSQPAVSGTATPYGFVYFSFTTLTTLGYGDILPLTESLRSLAILEAILGQLYLTVIIARLVGMQISQTNGRASDEV